MGKQKHSLETQKPANREGTISGRRRNTSPKLPRTPHSLYKDPQSLIFGVVSLNSVDERTTKCALPYNIGSGSLLVI